MEQPLLVETEAQVLLLTFPALVQLIQVAVEQALTLVALPDWEGLAAAGLAQQETQRQHLEPLIQAVEVVVLEEMERVLSAETAAQAS
jgi:hypothetical protein